jgi:peptide/nickel transport system substrate-binding protein
VVSQGLVQHSSRSMVTFAAVAAAAIFTAAGLASPTSVHAEPSHAIAIRGAPKHAPTFAHFDAVNPSAPRGGRIVHSRLGSFDSLNPFIIHGDPAFGVREFVIESLMARGLDEPLTVYGLLAESIDVPEDRSQATFVINPKAAFSDGRPVTADDVVFSFNVLRDKGRPNHRSYFKRVTNVERLSDREVRFVFDGGGDRELPIIVALMPILPSHLMTADTFEKTSLAPITGSGPYTIGRIDAGRAITYTRNPNYWGRDLPVARGRFNFDEIRFDYFRDNNVMFESFKNGDIDLRLEDDPALWSQGYNVPAVTDGRIIKTELETQQPASMTGLAFNTRRPMFANPGVREALIQTFDFEFANKSLFNGLYERTDSFFERSALSSAGQPANDEELQLLAPYAQNVKPEILGGTFKLPVTDGSGRNRTNLQQAITKLTANGYQTKNGKLVDTKTGQPLAFEILVSSASNLRLLQGFTAELQRIGIAATIRQVDSAQYQSRLRTYDYDMILASWSSTLSPGNEQTFRWSGSVADEDGSFNYVGVKNPAADAMISAMLAATTPEKFISAVRALDRVLLSGDYVIPLYHVPRHWVATARHIKYPAKVPVAGLNTDTWWSDKR